MCKNTFVKNDVSHYKVIYEGNTSDVRCDKKRCIGLLVVIFT